MGEIGIATSVLGGLALLLGTVLAAAHRFLRVEEDERVEQAEEKLPGSNCGACGQAGCRAFAEALVRGDAQPGQCTVSSAEGIAEIARLFGVDAGVRDKRVARLHCAGGSASVRDLAAYVGIESCRAAYVVNGGGRACAWGCLGLADCQRACSFDAIRMNPQRLPVVEVDACTACGDCVDVCPLDLFTLEPLAQKLLVQCNSPLRGEQARKLCHVACDDCGRCALDAPDGTIEMVGGLPVLNAPERCTEAVTARCPSGAIRWVEGNQFQEQDVLVPLRRGHG